MEIRRESLLYPDQPAYDYIDSYEIVIKDPENKLGILDVAEAFIRPGPAWVGALFALRNRIVSVFELKTPATIEKENNSGRNRWEPGSQAGIFKVFARTENEMILGEDDSHLDLRVSLFLEQEKPDGTTKRVTVTTVVHYNNRLGEVYFFFVKPFHRIIVPVVLKQNFRRLGSEADTAE